MSVYYLTSVNDESIKGLIAIGMSGGALFPELVKLDLVKVPVLDLFGSDDLPIVLENRLNKLKVARGWKSEFSATGNRSCESLLRR